MFFCSLPNPQKTTPTIIRSLGGVQIFGRNGRHQALRLPPLNRGAAPATPSDGKENHLEDPIRKDVLVWKYVQRWKWMDQMVGSMAYITYV